MKTFVCRVCSHIAFDQAPIDCPVCKAPIENFVNNNGAIKMPEDPNNLNETEKKHTPFITVSKECGLISGSCIDVHVKVGEIEHGMESEHYITFLDFYVNRKYLARVNLTYKRLHPAAVLHLSKNEGILTVIGNCNAHGSWMAEVNLFRHGEVEKSEKVA